MKNLVGSKLWALMALLGLSLALFVGCARERTPESVLDTPEHHVSNGMRSFEKRELDEAQREFKLALELDGKYSPAHTGMALVFAGQSGEVQDENEKDGLDDAKQNLDYAVLDEPEAPAPYFYMGEAYKQGYVLSEATNMYRKVLDLDKEYTAEANRSWELVQKIQRASPDTAEGKKVALVEAITRGDAAALFIQELKLEEVYERLNVKTFDAEFKTPKSGLEMGTETVVKLPPATDISDHVLRHDINTVIRMGVRGLEPYPNHTFRPDEKISRASYAMMLEDILIKATRDEGLATRFFGNVSPFPDLGNDLPYFNAVMVCTSRDIMAVADVRTGEFRPMGTVSGADALLAIRELKEQLRLL